MQTKSPLVRIAIMAGVSLATLVLFLAVRMQRMAHIPQSLASNHSATSAQPATPLCPAQKKDLTRAYGSLPLTFEANQGQTAPEVHYLAHGQGYQLFLTNQEAVLSLRQPAASGTKSANGVSLLAAQAHRKLNSVAKNSVLRMQFEGANPSAEIAGTKLLPGKTNYFIGNDPKKWHTDIPSYEAVRYQGVYPGVDLLFYGHQQRLEYDFIVAPGANPGAIALRIAGAPTLKINSQGDVVMVVGGGTVALQKPVIYQQVNGRRREIAGNYAIANDRQIRFSVSPYDHTQPLTIDPVLNYSTYVGGEGVDAADGIALDASGNAYIAGETTSTSFPQKNAEDGTPGDVASGTVFVTELNPGGTGLVYSTYIGGSGNGSFGEGADAIAVDTASPPNIYVTGFTGSPDFPVSTAVPPFQTSAPASAALGGSAYITKLAPSASGTSQLAYSSYLGGDTNDEGHGIAVDASGNAYIAGETVSTNFPTKGTQISGALTSPAGDAFLTVINTTTTGQLIYSTYLGGTGPGSNFLGFGDVAYGVTIDTNSNAYVVGGTTSLDFPTAGTAIIGSMACGVNTNGSAFISVINTAAGTLGYSHCLSGNTAEVALGVNLGTGVPAVVTKVSYITGTTESPNFPVTTGSIPPPATGVANGVAFVSLLNTATGALQYSTYLGGNNSDTGFSIGSDSSGNAYVTGQTTSADFPITQGALVVALANPAGAGFVAKIGPNGNGLADLVYSSYFGGQTPNAFKIQDSGRGIAVSGTNAYITGQMTSADMPVSSGAFQTALGAVGATNAYVANLPLTPTISFTPASINFGTQLLSTTSLPQFVTITNNTASAVLLTPAASNTGGNTADFATTAGTCGTPASVPAGASCTVGVTFTPSASGARATTLQIFDALDSMGHPMLVALSGNGSATASNITVTPTSLTLPGALLTTSSTGTVSIGNNGNSPLSIASIAAAPGVFTEASNTAACDNGAFPIVIAPSGTACVVTVTFSPVATTTPGPVAGSLTITQTGGNVATVPLSGPAWDFSVSVAAISVAKGATGTFPVLVTGLPAVNGFTGAVSFTCTPAMLITSCSVPTTNAAATPGASASGSITAASFIVPPQSLKAPPSALLRQVAFIMLAMALLFMIPSVRRFSTRLGMVGAMLVFILVAGCSGSAGGSKASTISITPSAVGGGGVTVTKPAITVNVTITQ